MRRQSFHRKNRLLFLPTQKADGAAQALTAGQPDGSLLAHLPLPHLGLTKGGDWWRLRDVTLRQHLQQG